MYSDPLTMKHNWYSSNEDSLRKWQVFCWVPLWIKHKMLAYWKSYNKFIDWVWNFGANWKEHSQYEFKQVRISTFIIWILSLSSLLLPLFQEGILISTHLFWLVTPWNPCWIVWVQYLYLDIVQSLRVLVTQTAVWENLQELLLQWKTQLQVLNRQNFDRESFSYLGY